MKGLNKASCGNIYISSDHGFDYVNALLEPQLRLEPIFDSASISYSQANII